MKKLYIAVMLAAFAAICVGCYGNMSNPVAPPKTPLPQLEHPYFEDAETAMAMYSQVTLDDVKSDIDAKFGAGEENTTEEGSKFYIYKQDDGYGVTIAYDSMDKVMGKVLLYEDVRQLAHLTAKPLEGAAYAISKGMEYSEAVEMLGGDAVEIAAARHIQEDGSELRSSLIVWVDENGASLQGMLDANRKFSEVTYQGVEQPE